MTMRYLMWTALAAGLMMVPAGTSQANDVVRLGGPTAKTGGIDADLTATRGGHFGGGFHGGHYGGHYGGYRGGYYGGYRGYYGGYRGYYGGYYRPYYANYYRPYYYGGYGGYGGYGYGGCGGYYSAYAYPSYYYPSYYGSPYPCAIASATIVTQQVPVLPQSTPLYSQAPAYVTPAPQQQPLLQQPNVNTYPYNGGPVNPVPAPQGGDNPVPMNSKPGVIPLDGRLVSLPGETRGGVSPVVTPDIQKLRYVSFTDTPTPQAPAIAPTTRFSYPAYGEQPITPAPRRTTNR